MAAVSSSANTSTDHLRSAMKQPSRPTTPASAAVAGFTMSPALSTTSTSTTTESPFLPQSPAPGSIPRPQTASSSSSMSSPPVSAPASTPTLPLHSSFNQHHNHAATAANSSVVSSGYTPKVSFDTFENPAASMFSYTLHAESHHYTSNRASRVFLCAASPDESGSQALDWALSELVRDGDELIVLRGIEKEELEKDHEVVREEARDLMRQIQEKGVEYDPDRKLSIIVEFIAGRVTQTLDRLIALYRPDSLVVGTRGQRTVMRTLGMAGLSGGIGSVSKYCLSHSPVPVIVVRPERTVRKAMAKRRKDPKRGRHFEEEISRMKTPNIQRMSLPVTPSSTVGQ